MSELSKQKEMCCENCQSTISFGSDLITTEKGVNGPRGIVPLGEILVFCSEKCVSDFFNGTPADDLPGIPRRIPY
jgi:hypothetical protein